MERAPLDRAIGASLRHGFRSSEGEGMIDLTFSARDLVTVMVALDAGRHCEDLAQSQFSTDSSARAELRLQFRNSAAGTRLQRARLLPDIPRVQYLERAPLRVGSPRIIRLYT